MSSNPVHGEVYSIQYYAIVCQWLATGRWFSSGIPVFYTNKTDIAEIFSKVALNIINKNNLNNPLILDSMQGYLKT